jgi:hypothetical protein
MSIIIRGKEVASFVNGDAEVVAKQLVDEVLGYELPDAHTRDIGGELHYIVPHMLAFYGELDKPIEPIEPVQPKKSRNSTPTTVDNGGGADGK